MELEKGLREVEGELDAVQADLDALLQRQEDLLDRKNLLKLQLESLQSTTSTGTSSTPSSDWEGGAFPWDTKTRSILQNTFKMEVFRPLQLSCINATLSGKDVILIMPTGGGKSLCYQLPAILGQGLTLVISPLVSLMEDQLLAVKRLGIESCALNASSSREDVNRTHAQMSQPSSTLKLLYVTPEKIAKSKRFMSKLEKTYENNCLSRIVIDEVCKLQGGWPEYRGIVPYAPLLCSGEKSWSH
jgi:ATP-dependent DNA helicase Q1